MREFRPLGLGGVFDAFLKAVCNRQAMILNGLYCLVSLPALYVLVRGFIRLFFDFFSSFSGGMTAAIANNPLYGDFAPPALLVVGLLLVYVFFNLLYNLMSSELYAARFLETPYRLGASFAAQVRRIPGHLLYLLLLGVYYGALFIVYSILAAILAAVSVALGMSGQEELLIVIAMLAVAIFFGLASGAEVFIFGVMPAYATDRKRLFPAIGASFVLSVKSYFRLWGAIVLFRIILVSGTIALNLGLSQLAVFIMTSARATGGQMEILFSLNTLIYIMLVIIPGQAAENAFHAVLYVNQRVRHEGLGAELLARQFVAGRRRTETEGA